MKKIILSFALIALAAFTLVGCDKDKPADTNKTYTYRLAANSLPTTWNVHTYQSNDATNVLSYTEDSLYEFDYNDAKDGYKIVPSMAVGEPQDVTSQYVGQFGVKANETGKAYKITLKNNLKFDNGDAINAQTFIDSVKLLLNPKAANYRADSVYSGNLKIVGAESYVKGGTYGTDGLFINGESDYVDPATAFTKDADGYYQKDGKDIVLVLGQDAAWGAPIEKYFKYLTDYIMDEETGRVKIFAKAAADGTREWILTRSLKEAFELAETEGYYNIYSEDGETLLGIRSIAIVGEGEDADYEFKDLEGNPVTREVNAAGDAWVYKDASGAELTAWAKCAPKSLDYDFYDLEGNKISRHVNEAGTAWVYEDKDGNEVAAWAGSSPISETEQYFNEHQDKNGIVKVNDQVLSMVREYLGMLQVDGTYADYQAACAAAGNTKNGINYADVEWEEWAYYAKTFDEVPWSTVGFLPVEGDANSFVIVLTKELTGFYLKYALCTSFSLVHKSTYEACTSITNGVYNNDYATSVAKYVGFGPYKLVSYVSDSEIKFERNPYWWGYQDETVKKFYQTTNISIKQVSTDATRYEMFLKGETDSFGLTVDYMDDYQSSKHTYYTEGDSTWFIALNPSLTGLTSAQEAASPVNEGNTVNKTVLTIKEFRMALSFSVDRQAYALALDPTGGVAKALYGNMIISDPESGTAYRTTEQAKDVILNFWGLADSVGAGKDYATKEEAIESITGYDLAGARALFNQAYETAVADGLLDAAAIASGKWEVQIMIGQPGSGSSTYYNKGYEYLKKNWTNAVKGTSFEGHLTFKQSQPLGSSGFSTYLKNNSIDLLFGVGWTGSALDPYGLMEAYVAPNYQYDPAWDTKTAMLDIKLNVADEETGVKSEKVLRASVYSWGKVCLSGDEIEAVVVVNGQATDEVVVIEAGSTADADIRLNILAAVEGAVLEQYDMIPVNLDSSANLKGMKIKYGSEEYVYGVGRGGVKYMTYNFDDAAWDAYVNSQPGKVLNYK